MMRSLLRSCSAVAQVIHERQDQLPYLSGCRHHAVVECKDVAVMIWRMIVGVTKPETKSSPGLCV